MGMGVSSRKNQEMPGAHKIGAAVSGPRIAGEHFTDMRLLRDGKKHIHFFNINFSAPTQNAPF